MTPRNRVALGLLAAMAVPVSARPAGQIAAYGIVTWNSTSASVENGSAAGISSVNRMGDGQIEVVFSAAGYQSLKSTVIVSCRHAVPCSIAWDTLNANSVRVRSWEANGAPSPNGSFSILLVQGSNTASATPKAAKGKK